MTQHRRRLKRGYAELFRAVSEIVRRADPMGLVGMGAPDDEYDSEVRMILARLRSAPSASDLARAVSDVFSDMFGLECALTVAESESLAREIWPLWLESPFRS